MKDSLKGSLLYCLGVLLVAIFFQIISLAINNDIISPSVITIFNSFIGLISSFKTYLYIGKTMLELLISLIAAIIIGIVLGTIAGLKKDLYKVFKPLMSLFRVLPIIMLIQALILLAKLDYIPTIASSMILIPIIYEGTYQGIAKIDRGIINAYKLDTKFNLRVLFKIYLPLINEVLLSAIISAMGIGIKIIVTTEYICGCQNTIGYALMSSIADMEYSNIYGYSIILIIIIILLELIPRLIKGLILKIKNQAREI